MKQKQEDKEIAMARVIAKQDLINRSKQSPKEVRILPKRIYSQDEVDEIKKQHEDKLNRLELGCIKCEKQHSEEVNGLNKSLKLLRSINEGWSEVDKSNKRALVVQREKIREWWFNRLDDITTLADENGMMEISCEDLQQAKKEFDEAFPK